VSLVLMTCKDNPPGPPTDRPPDTTSHEFTWQTFTFGDGASSVLYDVAIINDTLAYAVGEIYKLDSTGNWDPNAYNLARWNGQHWELKRIYTYSTCNAVDYAPLRAIWVFSDSSILVTSGGSLGRYNGRINTPDCSIRPLVTGSINKIWASSENGVYVVGNNGFIAHYDGVEWRRIESGTTLDIGDLWGATDRATARLELLAVAGNPYTSLDRKILRISGTTVTVLSDSGIGQPLTGIWFDPNRHYYVVGSGIYEKDDLSDPAWRNSPLDITTFYINKVRGTAVSDVFVCGAYGELLHYNGSSWWSYRSETGLVNGQYYAIAAKGTLVIAVGYESPRAVVVIGRR